MLIAILAIVVHFALIPRYYEPINNHINIRDATTSTLPTIRSDGNSVKSNNGRQLEQDRKDQPSIMGHYLKKHLSNRSRSLVFCINSVLFLASGFVGISS